MLGQTDGGHRFKQTFAHKESGVYLRVHVADFHWKFRFIAVCSDFLLPSIHLYNTNEWILW